MFHSDSQISMRPLSLNMLFTLVDHIFMICLTKFMSWLVGLQLRICSSIYICIIISLLYFCYEGVIQFWAVTWALGMKRWLKSQGH